MKKILKSRVFFLILGLIIAGTTVYAVTYEAKDISFTPKDSTWKKSNGEDITNVKDALDDLYVDKNTPLIDKADLTTNFVYSIGYRTGPKTVSIDIEKGNYLIVFTSSYAFPATFTAGIVDSIEETQNNSNCTALINKKLVNSNSQTHDSELTASAVYKCKVNKKETVSFSHNHNPDNNMAENFLLYSIKID